MLAGCSLNLSAVNLQLEGSSCMLSNAFSIKQTTEPSPVNKLHYNKSMTSPNELALCGARVHSRPIFHCWHHITTEPAYVLSHFANMQPCENTNELIFQSFDKTVKSWGGLTSFLRRWCKRHKVDLPEWLTFALTHMKAHRSVTGQMWIAVYSSP